MIYAYTDLEQEQATAAWLGANLGGIVSNNLSRVTKIFESDVRQELELRFPVASVKVANAQVSHFEETFISCNANVHAAFSVKVAFSGWAYTKPHFTASHPHPSRLVVPIKPATLGKWFNVYRPV